MKQIQKLFRFFVGLTIVMVLVFGSQTGVLAQGTGDGVTPPLFSELTWNDLGVVQKDVQVNGQNLTLDGAMFAAVQPYQTEIPQTVFDFYSIKNLQTLGWNFLQNGSFETIYWNPSGRFLSVEIMDCENSQTDYCVNVWLSVESGIVEPPMPVAADSLPGVVPFHKTKPTNNTTIPVPDSSYRVLQWSDAQIGSTDRYLYCMDETDNDACDSGVWIQRNSLYSGGPGDFTLKNAHTYYWQVKTRDAKTVADGGTWFTFKSENGFDGPTVKSILRLSPTTASTNATSVTFKVTFSASVTGVSVNGSDFALTKTGVSGSSITGVIGSGAVYNVTVSTGTGNGTIRLDVVDDDSIKDGDNAPLGGAGVGNGNYIKGQVYTIDKTFPKVVSSVRVNPATTNLANVKYTVTFTETVTGVDKTDFTLTTTGGISGAAVTTVTGTGAKRTVTVNTGTGNGTLRLNVKDNDTIKDNGGNKLGGTGTGNGSYSAGQTYKIDKTIPIVSSIVRVNPNPTHLASVKFTVTFSESVTGVNSSDFTLTRTGGLTGGSVTGVSGSGKTYTVTVNTGSNSGTLRLNVTDNDSIKDGAGTALGGTGVGNGTYLAGPSYDVIKP